MHKHPEEAIILSHNRLEIRWINNSFRKIIVKFPEIQKACATLHVSSTIPLCCYISMLMKLPYLGHSY